MKEDISLPDSQAIPKRKKFPLLLYYILLVSGWTLVVAASLAYNVHLQEQHALESARLLGRTAVEKDVIYRQWNSNHGGVFVPVVPGRFEPNPYLPEAGREITDARTGKVYTKINPAYMTRLVHELGAKFTGVRGHITSNKPIRPGNAPDTWESDALRKLERREVTEVSNLEPGPDGGYMRLIRGLDTNESCMPCHAHQGYKVGDVRGGISVEVPMKPFYAAMEQARHTLFTTHIGIWLLGFIGVSLNMRQIAAGLRERDQAEDGLRALTVELEQRVFDRTQALRLRQQEMQAFMDNANAGVYLKDIDGTYRMANALFAGMFDLKVSDIVGRKDSDLLSPEQYVAVHAQDREVVSTGHSQEFREGFIFADGARYGRFAFPVIEEGRVVALGGLLVDMSERDRTEHILREAKVAAENASRAKSDFLANMSHEIRTPLNGVIGMADLLLRTRLTAEQTSMAAAIKSSGDSLLAVLNDVLDISKIEAGKMAVEHIPFQLRDMLFESVQGLTPIAYKKALELILHVSPTVPDHLIGDPVRLRQVILNLVNNALKFTDKGEVVVTVLLLEEKEGKAHLRFSVTDTGIGIPAEKQDKIFQAFEQVDTSTTRKYGGTGLGLAICAKLLNLMGGNLDLKSAEGFGSSFWFELELPIDASRESGHKPLVCSVALHGFSVLIVDDNGTNLRILRETLNDWGMVVEQAASADEAFVRLKQARDRGRPFRLLLSDLQMPDKDGIDLLRMVRTDPLLAETPAILLTSANLPEAARKWNGPGAFFDCVLDKPVRPELLMRSIAKALNIWESYDVQNLQREHERNGEKLTSGLKVLLAEDVEMNQMVATRMLSELGCKVTVVSDGEAAVNAVTKDDYDLVFMDIQMPVMDGIEATQAIRDLENRGLIKKRTSIVAMTANALKGDKAKYLAVGMDGYLAKPILLDDLRKTIWEALGMGHPGGKTALSKGPNWCTVQGAYGASAQGEEGQEAGKDSPPAGVAGGLLARPGPEASFPVPEKDDGAESGPIDWTLLEQAFAGQRDFITDSMVLYMRDAPKLLQEASKAIERQDNATLTVNAHALKAITGYFTRGDAYNLCYKLEEMGRESLLPAKKYEAETLVGELRRQMDAMLAEMDAFTENAREN